MTRSLSGKALNKSQAERAGQTESYLGRDGGRGSEWVGNREGGREGAGREGGRTGLER